MHSKVLKAIILCTFAKKAELFSWDDTHPAGGWSKMAKKCNMLCKWPHLGTTILLKDAFSFSGQCEQCKGKCHWRRHSNMPFKFVVTNETRRETNQDIYNR